VSYSARPRITFLYEIDLNLIPYWQDGLFQAVVELESEFEITRINLANTPFNSDSLVSSDFVLGWGGFNSGVDHVLTSSLLNGKRVGLCLGGYGFNYLPRKHRYDVIFYECEWARRWLEQQGVIAHLIHAFGVNTEIFNTSDGSPGMCLDYLSVGSFSDWKGHNLLLDKQGLRLAVGQVQMDNLSESMGIVSELIMGGVGVMGMVQPHKLRVLYQSSSVVLIGANDLGGGERAVLEARACGSAVELSSGNTKLPELLTSPIWDHHYYSKQIKKGIHMALS
jgi:hypothetical protein